MIRLRLLEHLGIVVIFFIRKWRREQEVHEIQDGRPKVVVNQIKSMC